MLMWNVVVIDAVESVDDGAVAAAVVVVVVAAAVVALSLQLVALCGLDLSP